MSPDKIAQGKKNPPLLELFAPMAKYPALVAAMAVFATLGALMEPKYAPPLLFFVGAVCFVAPHFLKRIILGALLLGVASHILFSGKEGTPVFHPKEKGCGVVEALLPRSNGMAFIVRSHTVDRSGSEAYRVRLTEKRALDLMPEPGDSICYEASWYPVEPPTVPGAFDTEKWLTGQNLAAYGKVLHWKSWRGHWVPERSFHRFRNWIRHRLSRFLDSAETGLLMGLLAGDRSGIPEALRSDFQRSGLVHVLAISGFHVVLLAGMLMVLLKATRLPHKAVGVIGILLLLLYVPVTGGSPAVRRAVIMFAVPQVGLLFQRPAAALNSLGVALLFLTLPSPDIIWNPGFQLSAAATLGIILGSSHNPLKELPEGLRKNALWSKFQTFVLDPTYVTLCATFATAPFLIYHFKTLSPLAWLGNIVIVPLISLGMEAGLFALMMPVDFLTGCFCSAASLLLRTASFLTSWLSDSAGAAMTVGPYPPFVLLLMGFVFALLPAVHKNRAARLLGACGLLIFSGLFLWETYWQAERPRWSLTAIDIGQGDGLLLDTPSGRHILIDSGPNDRRDSGKDIVVPYLRYRGILELDAIVVTHPDADHFGGTLSIIKTFPVKELWVSACARVEPKPDWIRTMAVALERGIPIRDIGRGFVWKDNSIEVQALHPANAGKCGETNEESITLRIKGLGHSAILTGDLTVVGERKILKSRAFLKSDVLKIGHHGSRTSSSTAFLKAVAPKLALISSGKKNRFRHPNKQVTDRLDSLGIPYLNTAKSGTVTVTFSEDTIMVERMLLPTSSAGEGSLCVKPH